MDFKNEYTTSEKKQTDSILKEEEQTEQNKVILSNDAFAVGLLLENLINKLEHLRLSSYK